MNVLVQRIGAVLVVGVLAACSSGKTAAPATTTSGPTSSTGTTLSLSDTAKTLGQIRTSTSCDDLNILLRALTFEGVKPETQQFVVVINERMIELQCV